MLSDVSLSPLPQAAWGGHLEVLAFARRNGCPWDVDTCTGAAFGGHLGVLAWARSKGCPWDSDTACAAHRKGHAHVLQWVLEHGCPKPDGLDLGSGKWRKASLGLRGSPVVQAMKVQAMRMMNNYACNFPERG